MATQVQNRRGSTSEHASFTGAVGEITVDTDKDVVVVHDGSTAGGHPALKQDLSNLPAGTIDNADINASAAIAGTKISPNFGSQAVVTTGTSTAASFIPTSSTVPTNGVYLPASNSVAISTNGTGRLFVDSSGNVGVGGSPSVQFQVTQNQAAYSYFDFYNTTAGGGIVWRQIVGNIANTGTTSIDFVKYLAGGFGIVNNDTNAANFTAFNVGASERMRLDSSGRLGLGTSSAGARLHVGTSSDAGIWAGFFGSNLGGSVAPPANYGIALGYNRSGFFGEANIVYGTGTGAGLGLQFASYDGTTYSNRMLLDGAGRLGIGTTTVAGKLHTVLDSGFIAGQAWDSKTAIFGTASSGALGIAYDDTNGADISSIIPLVAYKPLKLRGSELVFNIQGNEKAKLDTSGRLLVGTSTSTGGSLLQVNDNRIRVATAKTPASATDTGAQGEICWDANYLYVCTATNTWKRAALSTW
jgi:hypothetical protein